jgi:hypothetical protein
MYYKYTHVVIICCIYDYLQVRKRYAQYVLPLSEAEWVGLDLNEACAKLQDAEEHEKSAKDTVPMMLRLEQSFVHQLMNPVEKVEKKKKRSLLSKLF